jgi:hypothetical protein
VLVVLRLHCFQQPVDRRFSPRFTRVITGIAETALPGDQAADGVAGFGGKVLRALYLRYEALEANNFLDVPAGRIEQKDGKSYRQDGCATPADRKPMELGKGSRDFSRDLGIGAPGRACKRGPVFGDACHVGLLKLSKKTFGGLPAHVA